MTDRRRTKIVATLGPASRSPATLRELIEAGADAFRLNFSHGDEDQHTETIERVRSASADMGREVALLGDLPGPKLRIGEVPGDAIELAEGDDLTLTVDSSGGDGAIPVSWTGLTEAVEVGDEIYLADGTIRLRVRKVVPPEVRCEVELGGTLSSRKGLNLPGSTRGLPATGASDIAWVEFAVRHDIDLLAVSFVRRSEDLRGVNERLTQLGSDIEVIAKIEKPEALDNAEEIVRSVTGGIMVARGDLGIELPIQRVASVQKRLLRLAGRYSVPTITATQMLASMVNSNRPTRAEATDVANAIHDGTDAVMLSEETAIGQFPVEAVRMMAAIATETEEDLPYDQWLWNRAGTGEAGEVAETVAQSAVNAAYRLDLAALVVPSRSGRTARLVSARRPRLPILVLSPDPGTVRRVKLLFGVESRSEPDVTSLRELLDDCASQAREAGLAKQGDLVGVTAGLPEQRLGTNLFEVHRVP